ncbi:hypothetical protein BJ166DRAFT_481261 [Pestalotiopsis sp. NC0098]|nr:hypothetical protein BJ166DRAFT_481261 [Pestalotiopsis sp. NC0098]
MMASTVVLSAIISVLILSVFAIKSRFKGIQRRKHPKDASITPLPTFDWEVKEPLKIRNFKPIYFITMGVRTVSPCELITIDCNYLSRIQLRQETLRDHTDKVLGCLPAGVKPVQEVYEYLLNDYLPVRYPTMFSKEKKFMNHVTNVPLPLQSPSDPLEAFRLLGQTIEDDLFILQQEPEGHRCVGAMCTSPAGFDPSEKIGKLLKEIHEPVPAYEKIGPSMERYFSRVEVGKNAVRTNWSITTSPVLLNYDTNHVKEGDVFEKDMDVDISQARLRVELQTLSRLPRTRALLFSFKTYTYSLEEVKSEGLGPQLADAVEGLKQGNAEGMWTYKGGVRWGKSVCEYLRHG